MDPGDGHRQRRRPRLLLSFCSLFLLLTQLLPPTILCFDFSGDSGVESQARLSDSPHRRNLRPLTIPSEPRHYLLGDSQWAREPIFIPLAVLSRLRLPLFSAKLHFRSSYFTETAILTRSGLEQHVLSRSKVRSDELFEAICGLCSSFRDRYGTIFSSTRCIAFIFGSVRLWVAATMTTRSGYGNRCFTSLNPRSDSWFYRKKAARFTGPYVSDLGSDPSFEETILVLHSRYVATNFVDGIGLANTPEPNRKQDDFQAAARMFKRKLGQHQCLLGFRPNFASALLNSRMGFGPSFMFTHKKTNRSGMGFRKISFGLLWILKSYLICFMGFYIGIWDMTKSFLSQILLYSLMLFNPLYLGHAYFLSRQRYRALFLDVLGISSLFTLVERGM